MLRRLSAIKRRVDHLARETRMARCSDNHDRYRVVDVWGDEPTPAWPEAVAGGRCVCGADLEYVQIVNRVLPSPTSPETSGETS